MKKVTDTEKDIDQKLIFIFEKIYGIVRKLVWDRVKNEGISPLQLQILTRISSRPGKMARVSQLAMEYGLTQATVSDAITSLSKKGLVKKIQDHYDRRAFNIILTSKGEDLIERIGEWSDALQPIINELDIQQKRETFMLLMHFLRRLVEENIVDVIRMCLVCDNFVENLRPESDKPHYCRLTEKYMSYDELRIDCPKQTRKI